jgi:hypothetical protein
MLFVVVNIWVVLPHFADWGKTKGRLNKAQKTLNEFQNEIGQMGALQRKMASLPTEKTELPSEDQAAQFQHEVQNQAIESKVELTGLQKLTSRTNQFFLELTLNISVLSGEAELVDFLYKLGAGNSLIRVRDLALHTDMARQRLNANVKLVASYKKSAPSRATSSPTPDRTAQPATPASPPPRTQPQRPPVKDAPQQTRLGATNRVPVSPAVRPKTSTVKEQ